MTRDEAVNILDKAAVAAYNLAVKNDDGWLKTVSLRIRDELKRRR